MVTMQPYSAVRNIPFIQTESLNAKPNVDSDDFFLQQHGIGILKRFQVGYTLESLHVIEMILIKNNTEPCPFFSFFFGEAICLV